MVLQKLKKSVDGKMNKEQDIIYQYTGKEQPKQKAEDPNQRVYYPYIPSEDFKRGS